MHDYTRELPVPVQGALQGRTGGPAVGCFTLRLDGNHAAASSGGRHEDGQRLAGFAKFLSERKKAAILRPVEGGALSIFVIPASMMPQQQAAAPPPPPRPPLTSLDLP